MGRRDSSRPFICSRCLNLVAHRFVLKLSFFDRSPRTVPSSFEWLPTKGRQLVLCHLKGGHWTRPPYPFCCNLQWATPNSARSSSSSSQSLLSLAPSSFSSYSPGVSFAANLPRYPPNSPLHTTGRRNPCIFLTLAPLVRVWDSIRSAIMGTTCHRWVHLACQASEPSGRPVPYLPAITRLLSQTVSPTGLIHHQSSPTLMNAFPPLNTTCPRPASRVPPPCLGRRRRRRNNYPLKI